MAGKFVLYKDKKGEFRFRLKASNGQIILASEGYRRRVSALKGIASVQKNARMDIRFERKDTRAGKYRFNLKAVNGQVIGTSESYNTAASREKGVASVGRSAPGAAIVDLIK